MNNTTNKVLVLAFSIRSNHDKELLMIEVVIPAKLLIVSSSTDKLATTFDANFVNSISESGCCNICSANFNNASCVAGTNHNNNNDTDIV